MGARRSGSAEDIASIFVVSDATGATAESVVTSVLVQFGGQEFHVRRFPFTRTAEQVDEIVAQAPRGRCMVVFTLVQPELRNYLLLQGGERNLIMVDVIGPLLTTFTGLLKRSPAMKLGALRHKEEELRGLAEAIHFARLHDDGQGMKTLEESDLVILGPSRTGKTPTSFYLACRKLKVANVPVIAGVPVPRKVVRLPLKKVGFLMSIDRLVRLRAERSRRYRGAEIPRYSSEAYILEEVEYCRKVYRQIPGIATVDVTNRSIEEISEWITHHVL